MRGLIVAALCTSAMIAVPAAAEARGCITGALVGGLAGHAAGHGLLGAAAGCVAGRAIAHRRTVPAIAAPMTGSVRPALAPSN